MSGAPAPAKVDCIRAIRSYVDRMIKPKDKAAEVLGMKALLLDRETVRVWGGWTLPRLAFLPTRARCTVTQPPLPLCRKPSWAWCTPCTRFWTRRVRAAGVALPVPCGP